MTQQPARPALGARSRSRTSSILQAKLVPLRAGATHPLGTGEPVVPAPVQISVQQHTCDSGDTDLLSDVIDDPWRDKSTQTGHEGEDDGEHDTWPQAGLADPTSSTVDRTTSSTAPPDLPPDTVEVYVHKSRRGDTLAKIILSYRIDAAVLRRCNRIWSADVFPDVLLLPVEQCDVQQVRLVDVIDEPQTPSHPPACDLDGVAGKGAARMAARRLEIVRTVDLPGLGEVGVARVSRSSLSYFPPSKNRGTSQYSDLARSSIDRDRYNALYNAASAGLFIDSSTNLDGSDKHRYSPPPSARSPRPSFESVRSLTNTYGVALIEDAFNGTQKILKRYKSRHNPKEIDLIEL